MNLQTFLVTPEAVTDQDLLEVADFCQGVAVEARLGYGEFAPVISGVRGARERGEALLEQALLSVGLRPVFFDTVNGLDVGIEFATCELVPTWVLRPWQNVDPDLLEQPYIDAFEASMDNWN